MIKKRFDTIKVNTCGECIYGIIIIQVFSTLTGQFKFITRHYSLRDSLENEIWIEGKST